MRARFFLPLVLISCTRSLTPSEAEFAKDLQGDTIRPEAVTVVRDVPFSSFTFTREPRPRVACRERIWPEITRKEVTVSPAAVVVWNTAYFAKDWHKPNFMAGYPERMDLMDAMLFAHEITHVWQWQNRKITGYSPLRAASEHENGADPYLFDISTDTRFLEFGYEQQASIVEEYVCCAMLDPEAPRTARLASLISQAMPLGELPRPDQLRIPWKDAKIEGICR
ncbi:hypothetical protein [uncultured Shimia sp.]|uniref:hypothetical protein n=1 Tax=uncultured Shimia sp. TaxID=573152 RepID=UPI00261341FE|nr:hypothetical protein [uncultured Shimia sp.]